MKQTVRAKNVSNIRWTFLYYLRNASKIKYYILLDARCRAFTSNQTRLRAFDFCSWFKTALDFRYDAPRHFVRSLHTRDIGRLCLFSLKSALF